MSMKWGGRHVVSIVATLYSNAVSKLTCSYPSWVDRHKKPLRQIPRAFTRRMFDIWFLERSGPPL